MSFMNQLENTVFAVTHIKFGTKIDSTRNRNHLETVILK